MDWTLNVWKQLKHICSIYFAGKIYDANIPEQSLTIGSFGAQFFTPEILVQVSEIPTKW